MEFDAENLHYKKVWLLEEKQINTTVTPTNYSATYILNSFQIIGDIKKPKCLIISILQCF